MEPELLIQFNSYLYIPCYEIYNEVCNTFDNEGIKDYVKSDIVDEFKRHTKEYLQPVMQFYIGADYEDINNLNDIIAKFTKYVSNLSYLRNTFE